MDHYIHVTDVHKFRWCHADFNVFLLQKQEDIMFCVIIDSVTSSSVW